MTYGGEASRECQACRAFHPVSAFDRDNKTCETRLLRKKLRYRAKTLQQRDEHRGQVGRQKARRHEAALQAVAAATAQPGVGVGLGQFSHLQGPGGFMLPFGGKFPGVADKDGGVGALAAARESIASVNPYGMFPGLAHMPFGQGAVEGSAAAARVPSRQASARDSAAMTTRSPFLSPEESTFKLSPVFLPDPTPRNSPSPPLPPRRLTSRPWFRVTPG